MSDPDEWVVLRIGWCCDMPKDSVAALPVVIVARPASGKYRPHGEAYFVISPDLVDGCGSGFCPVCLVVVRMIVVFAGFCVSDVVGCTAVRVEEEGAKGCGAGRGDAGCHSADGTRRLRAAYCFTDDLEAPCERTKVQRRLRFWQ
jgi:hypothetical protein